MLTRTLVWLMALCHILWLNELPVAPLITLLILALTLRPCRRHFDFVLIVATGFTLPHAYKTLFLEPNLDPYWQQTVEVDVEVVDFPKISESRIQFTGRLRSLNGEALGWRQPLLLINWYHPGRSSENSQSTHPKLRIGETWRLPVKLKPPRGLANPFGFDYERWLFTHKIRALAVVRARADKKNTVTKVQQLTAAPWLSVAHVRSHLHSAISDSSGQFPHYLKAIVLGDRSGLPESDRRLFQDTGTAHLFAISGLHVGMIAAAAFFLVSRIALLIPTGRYFSLQSGFVAAIVFAGFYALLAGFTLPTMRALIMIALFSVAGLLKLQVARINVFCLTVVIALLLNPWQVLGAGFWLSFGAVFILILLMEQMPWSWLSALQAQTRLVFAMAPMNALFFSGVSLLSPVFNGLLIPLFAFVIVPVAFIWVLLLGLDLPSFGLAVVFDNLFHVMLKVLLELESWVGIVVSVATPFWQGLLVLFVGTLILPPIIPKSLMLLVLGAVAVAGFSRKEQGDHLDLTVFDVGHGLAVLLEVGDKRLLYDTGFRYPSGFNAGTAILLPHFHASGIEQLDALVLSHDDGDHIGGYSAITEAVTIRHLWSGQLGREGSSNCHAAPAWRWQGWEFQFLNAQPSRARKNNDYSCVLSVSNENHRVLLTGDIEKKSERHILSNYSDLRADTLIVPHHGSATSSSKAFVTAVNASLGIVSVAYKNRYRLPNSKVLRRYQQIGTKILRTDDLGQIRLQIAPSGQVKISSERQNKPRFWHWTPPDPVLQERRENSKQS